MMPDIPRVGSYRAAVADLAQTLAGSNVEAARAQRRGLVGLEKWIRVHVPAEMGATGCRHTPAGRYADRASSTRIGRTAKADPLPRMCLFCVLTGRAAVKLPAQPRGVDYWPKAETPFGVPSPVGPS